MYQVIKNIKKILIIFHLTLFASILLFSQNFDKELSQYENLPDQERITAYLNLGQELFDDAPRNALKVTQKALFIAENTSNYKLACNALYQIAEIYNFIGDDEKELKSYQAGLDYAKKIADEDALFLFYSSIAYYKDKHHEFELAIKNYLYSLSISEDMKDKSSLPWLLNQIGLAYFNLSKYEDALQYFFRALSLKETINDKASEGTTLLNIGTVYSELNNYEKALDYFEQSLKIFEKQNLKQLQAKVLNNIGNIYRGIDNYTESIKYLKLSLRINLSTRNFLGVARAYNNLGTSNEELGKYIRSKNFYEKALRIYQQLEDAFGIATSYRNLGNVTIKLEQIDKAKEYLDQAMRLATDNNLLQVKKNVFYSYANLYSNMGEHRKSDYYYNRHIRLTDSLNNAEFRQRIAQMEVLYETEKKDRENKLLKLENEAQENAIERQRFMIAFLIIVAILMIALAALIYKFYKERKRSAAKLTEKNALLTKSEENLKMINATKDKFFSIIAHDLRNPFGSLAMIVDNLKMNIDKMEKDKVDSVIGSLEDTVARTGDLLTNLLDWSRTQTGRMEFAPRRINIAESIASIMPLLESTAASKDIKVNTSLEDVYIDADRNMIHTIVRNLVSNAIKFTPRGGNITVIVTRNNGFAETSVIDTGIGISDETMDELFRIDATIKTKGTENEQGTGLGLILCREFIEKHNGAINVTSKMGKGSKFVFSIPVDDSKKPNEKDDN